MDKSILKETIAPVAEALITFVIVMAIGKALFHVEANYMETTILYFVLLAAARKSR